MIYSSLHTCGFRRSKTYHPTCALLDYDIDWKGERLPPVVFIDDMIHEVKEYHKWKIGQINVQTCSDDLKLYFVLQECSRANLDVVCIQEVRRLNTGSVSHAGYSFYWNGLKRFRKHGVGIAIKEFFFIFKYENRENKIIFLAIS